MPKMRLFDIRRAVVGVCSLAGYFALHAQPCRYTGPGPSRIRTKTSLRKRTPSATRTPNFKVNVDVVQLFFNVKDKKGGLIPDSKRTTSRLLKTASRKPSNISPRNPICH